MEPATSARKVLLASHHANRRGSAISLVELGVRLPQYGFEPIFVFSKSGPLIDELAARGFAVHQVKRQGILRLGMIRQIQDIIRRHGIVLVHANSAVPFSKYIALAARLFGVPVVWHIREPVEDKRMARHRRWIRWLASKIVVLTRQQGRFFDLPSKVERVFNGVDLAHFHRQIDRVEAKRTLGYEPNEFLFVQIGSIEHNKGQSRSVRALSGVLPAQPHCRLLIVGGVVDTKEVEAVEAMTGADARLKAAVHLYGETSDVRPIIWAADCLLLPSLRESFPRTLMEAMAGGVPVIASTVGAVEDMVENGATGLVVASGEIGLLTDAMQEMTRADDARKSEISMNCEKSAARLFSMERHVATIASIYNKVLSPASSWGPNYEARAGLEYMTEEIVYDKYKKRGAGYHWQQISMNPLQMSAFVKGRYKKCIDLFAAHAGNVAGRELLDFGCGDGAFSFEMSRQGAKVSGIDLSAEAINFANRRHAELKTGGQFFNESCYETHFPAASFDGVLSTDVIEHVQDQQRFLAEISRVLRPGGFAVISTPIRLTEHPLDRLHVIEWFPDDFETLIRRVFPDSRFFHSHPVFWAEMSQRSRLLRTLVNLLSLHSNPFLHEHKWSLFSLQYAVCRKSL